MSRPMPTLCFAELVMVSTPTCAILTCHLASEVCRTTVVVGAVVDVAMRRRRSVQMTRLVYFARPSTFPAAETCSISSPSSCSRTPHSCSWLADNSAPLKLRTYLTLSLGPKSTKASFDPIRWCEQPLSIMYTPKFACTAAATTWKSSLASCASETVGSTTPNSEHNTSLSPHPLLPEEESASFADVVDLVDCFSLRGLLSQHGQRPANLMRPPLVSSSSESSQHRRRPPCRRSLCCVPFEEKQVRKGGPSPILRGAQLDDLQGEGRRVLANLVASTRQERLHEWAVRWGSPGGGVGRARAAVSGGAGPGGASVGVPGVGRAGGTGAGGTGAIGGTGGATVVGAAAGCPGSRRQEPLSPERLREWAVCWGSSGGGAARAGTAGSGGASAGVPRVDHVGGTSTGGTSATRGTGGAGPVGASDVVPQGGGIGGADTRGAIGGIGVGGSSWQESLSPQQLRTWAVRWGSPGGGGASGAGSEGDVPTGARASAAPHLASTLLCPEETRMHCTSRPHALTQRRSRRHLRRRNSPTWGKHSRWHVDFHVKRPPCSLPAFKVRYVARGFSQREGVDFFRTFCPTPKMTNLWVLLHVAAQRDYELHSLDFSTAFLHGSLHEAIWLCRPHGFTGSFPEGTKWSLRQPVHDLCQAPLDDLVFAIADTEAMALVKAELQERHTCTDLGVLRSFLGLQITRDRARRTITFTQSHMAQQVLQRFDFSWSSPQPTPLSTNQTLSAPPLDESVEPSGLYPELANTADVFTKALGSSDHQRFCTALGLVPTLPHLLQEVQQHVLHGCWWSWRHTLLQEQVDRGFHAGSPCTEPGEMAHRTFRPALPINFFCPALQPASRAALPLGPHAALPCSPRSPLQPALAPAARPRPCSRARPCSPRSPLQPRLPLQPALAPAASARPCSRARPCFPHSPLQPALAPAARARPCSRTRPCSPRSPLQPHSPLQPACCPALQPACLCCPALCVRSSACVRPAACADLAPMLTYRLGACAARALLLARALLPLHNHSSSRYCCYSHSDHHHFSSGSYSRRYYRPCAAATDCLCLS
ncbi:unnamed protein product [Closterium sp. NIES-53]